eukprot:gene16959-8928_t
MGLFGNKKKDAGAASGGGKKHAEVGTTIKVQNYNVVVDKQIAEGGFAVVFLAHDAANPSQKYALKKILAMDAENRETTKNEIGVMMKLKANPYVR